MSATWRNFVSAKVSKTTRCRQHSWINTLLGLDLFVPHPSNCRIHCCWPGKVLGVLIGPLEARRIYHLSDGFTLWSSSDIPTPCNKIDKDGWYYNKESTSSKKWGTVHLRLIFCLLKLGTGEGWGSCFGYKRLQKTERQFKLTNSVGVPTYIKSKPMFGLGL